MKTYTTTTKEKKSRKSLIALIIGLALIACAIIITLCVTLTGPSENVNNIIPPSGEQEQKYVMPLDEYEMGKDFSDKVVYNQTLKQWRTHNGVDFLTEAGAKVVAIMGGKVKSVENTTLEGTVITIEQTDGITAIYKSLSEDVKVAEGDDVSSGDELGSVAQNMATERKEGTHLHLEMKKDGEYLSPLEYLPDGADK